jgi:hypothetical protein
VTLIATPDAGYTFVNWTEGGVPVSASPSFSFIGNGAHSLAANFTLIIPQLSLPASAPGTLKIEWPAALPGWVLQESPDLSPGSWVTSGAAITVSGSNKQAIVAAGTGRRFFRLVHP